MAMPKPSKFAELTHTVTRDVVEHPRDLTRVYSERYGISRVAAGRYVKRLESEGWIARTGPSTHPVFSPGYKRSVFGHYRIQGLEEHVAWEEDFRPFLSLKPNVQNIVSHGFTEMVNNAIDHSGGNAVTVLATQDGEELKLLVTDNGVGIFQKIAEELSLPDLRQALFELSKGKLTTDPSRHSGERVFFTSRMFDYFAIYANDLRFSHLGDRPHDVLKEDASFGGGTRVYMTIALDSARTTSEVYAAFTDAPEDYDFSRTVVPMRLAQFGDETLVSRSQAKRLIARFDRFKTVVLDFEGVREVGQAFADELFRVYANAHPDVQLVPQHMTEQVERMWLRAVAPRPA